MMLLTIPPPIDEPSTAPFIGDLCIYAAAMAVLTNLPINISISAISHFDRWPTLSIATLEYLPINSSISAISHFDRWPTLSIATSEWTWNYVWMIPVFLGFTILVYSMYNAFLHPLRKVPGPRLAAISPFWQVNVYLKGRAHLEHIRLHEKYGPIVRTSPNTVIINDPTYFPVHANWDKSQWWLAFRGDPTYLGHVSYLELKQHVQRKKLVQGGYQGSAILKNEAAVNEHISTLMTQIKRFSGKAFDFSPWSQYLTLDIVMQMMFSEPMGFLKSGSDVDDIIATLQPFLAIVNVMALLPTVSKIILTPVFFKWLVPKPNHSRGIGRIHRLAYDQIANRHDDLEVSSTKHKDILQWIINKNQVNPETALPWKLLEQEMVGPVLAASDSGACVIRTAILYISTNGAILNRLLAEIDAADAKGLLSRPVPQFREVRQHIPYLDLIIKETMRIYPPTGIPLPRAVPKGGAVINGYYLPAGTSVGISQWAVGRSKKIFGDDADVFRPERWDDPKSKAVKRSAIEEELEALDIDASAVKSDSAVEAPLSAEEEAEAEAKRRLRDSGYMPFSLGPMQCTGRNVAMVEIYKTMTQLYRQFDIQIVNPTKPWKDINKMPMIQWDFWLKMTERRS